MADILPDCMMPDGAEPCAGYRQSAEQRAAQIASRDKEIAAMRELLCECEKYVASVVPQDGEIAAGSVAEDIVAEDFALLRRIRAALTIQRAPR